MPISPSLSEAQPALRINRHRRLAWGVSLAAALLSVLGMVLCWLDPAIRAPLRPGLDFTGGTQIQLERACTPACTPLATATVQQQLERIPLPHDPGERAPNLGGVGIQILDNGASLLLRLPNLTADQSQAVVNDLAPVAGPFQPGGLSVETIGPTLGAQLLRGSLVSLLVSFVGIAIYIAFRYDRLFAFLALFCLGHDVLITAGLFAWLGLLRGVEVNSLFAVALLTVAGYSVNDTVVVFDRIREKRRLLAEESLEDQADAAVAATLTRSLYTSLTTLLPLLALLFFGGSTLFWFALALAVGILVGTWSSIGIAPTLLPVLSR
ncbi:MAG: protein translocase subunit SecF [Synechococcus sp.]